MSYGRAASPERYGKQVPAFLSAMPFPAQVTGPCADRITSRLVLGRHTDQSPVPIGTGTCSERYELCSNKIRSRSYAQCRSTPKTGSCAGSDLVTLCQDPNGTDAPLIRYVPESVHPYQVPVYHVMCFREDGSVIYLRTRLWTKEPSPLLIPYRYGKQKPVFPSAMPFPAQRTGP